MKKTYIAPITTQHIMLDAQSLLTDSKTRFSDDRPGNGETNGEDASTGDDYGNSRSKGLNTDWGNTDWELPNWE